MTNDIIMVSNRKPDPKPQGGLAVAMFQVLGNFRNVSWYAVGNAGVIKLGFDKATGKTIQKDSLGASDAINNFQAGSNADVKELLFQQDIYKSHYETAANEVIYPLGLDMPEYVRPNTTLNDCSGTFEVCKGLAEHIAKECEDDPTKPIWIQDYQLMLLPKVLRERGIKNPIVYFHHTCLPEPEALHKKNPGDVSLYKHFLEGLKYCDVANFQTAETARRFMKLMGTENPPNLAYYESTNISVKVGSEQKKLQVGNYPISVDPEKISREAKKRELESSAGKRIAKQLVAPNVMVSFERGDYVKCIPERLEAYKLLMERHPDLRGKVQLCTIAHKTRNSIKAYRDYAERVSELVNEINSNNDWHCDGELPIVLESEYVQQSDCFKIARGTKDQSVTTLVTSKRDGMNLVVKEGIMSQNPKHAGPVICSSGAGAAVELNQEGCGAIIYDPDDPEGHVEAIYNAMLKAIIMSQEEANMRCEVMQNHIREYDIEKWGNEHVKVINRVKESKGKVMKESRPTSSLG